MESYCQKGTIFVQTLLQRQTKLLNALQFVISSDAERLKHLSYLTSLVLLKTLKY